MDPTTTPSPSLLYQETDARFWLQTGYKVGKRLDTQHDPVDNAKSKVWWDIYHKVEKESPHRWTFNDPKVRAFIERARTSDAAAAGHLAAAQDAHATGDDAARDAHAQAAAQAAQATSEALRRGRAHQPPTVSPLVAEASAAQVAAEAGHPPPAPVVAQLPPDHPAVSSPRAAPALPPQAVAEPVPRGNPLLGPHDPPPPAAPPPALDPLATARALAAPRVAVDVHAEARAREAAGVPIPAGTTSFTQLAQMRREAQARAASSPSDSVGVVQATDGSWSTLPVPSTEAAYAWYSQLVDAPTGYRYAAFYDRASPAWPVPVQETLGVADRALAPLRDRPPEPTGIGWGGVAIGAAVVAGVVGVIALSRGGGGS